LSQRKKTFVFRYHALLRDWSLFHRCLENAADTSDTTVDGCSIELTWLLTRLSKLLLVKGVGEVEKDCVTMFLLLLCVSNL